MITVKGLDEHIAKMQKLISTSPNMEKRIREVIKKTLKEVRGKLAAGASSGLQMESDPRKAYKAVRFAVYRRILGGQVNILQKRKAGKPGNYQKPLKGLPTKGGNRWGRSARTTAMEGYAGTDRGFVLRFLNAGTQSRRIVSYTNAQGEKHDIKRGGNRGSIGARNWFGPASQKELEAAVGDIQKLMDRIINEEVL